MLIIKENSFNFIMGFFFVLVFCWLKWICGFKDENVLFLSWFDVCFWLIKCVLLYLRVKLGFVSIYYWLKWYVEKYSFCVVNIYRKGLDIRILECGE